MRVTSLSIILLAGLVVGACSEASAPLDEHPSFASWRWATESNSGTTLTSDGSTWEIQPFAESEPVTGTSDVPESAVRHKSDAPPLETYQARFRATQGRKAQFYIHYNMPWGAGPLFLKLVIPSQAQLVDETGRPLNRGESVDITIDIDPETYLVSFGPHGATFDRKHPAELILAMDYADWTGHSKGDAEHLELFYQAAAGEPWGVTPNGVSFDPASFWTWIPLYHFSNYAIAW